MKSPASDKDISMKIFEGLKLAFQKLWEEKKKQNGTLIFSKDGEIIRVKPGEVDK